MNNDNDSINSGNNNSEEVKDSEENEFEDNFFNIISFKDRIKENKTLNDKIKNELIKSIVIIVAYFFASANSNYLVILKWNVGDEQIRAFLLLWGFLTLVILSNLFGLIPGVIGAFFGDLIYQIASINEIGSINWGFIIVAVIIGASSGIQKYDKDETIPKLKIMKLFYFLIMGAFLTILPITLFIDINLSVPFIVGCIVSFVFIGPIIMVVIDRTLNKVANIHGNIYISFLTHHYITESDHAVPMNLGGYNIFLCTRCTGTMSGIAFAFFIDTILRFRTGSSINSNIALIVCIILPILGLVDWGTQKLQYRTSNDILRLITGFLLGISMHMLTLMEGKETEISILLFVYFGIFVILLIMGNKRMKTPDFTSKSD